MKNLLVLIVLLVSCTPSSNNRETSDVSSTEEGSNSADVHDIEFKDLNYINNFRIQERIESEMISIIRTVDEHGIVKDSLEAYTNELGSSATCSWDSGLEEWEFTEEGIKLIETYRETYCEFCFDPTVADSVWYKDLLKVEDPRDLPCVTNYKEVTKLHSVSNTGEFIVYDQAGGIVRTETQTLSRMELFDKLPSDRLRILRNTIFAKYGYIFQSEDLKSYFTEMDWYAPRVDNVDDSLSTMDKEIIEYILTLEAKAESQ